MREAGADVLTETIAGDVAAQLEAGNESAYTLISSDEGVAAGRVVTGEGMVAAGAVVATEAGVTATRMIATEAGAAAEQVVSTDAGVEYTAVVVAAAEDGAEEASGDAASEAKTTDTGAETSG
jgi:hypothetical protein